MFDTNNSITNQFPWCWDTTAASPAGWKIDGHPGGKTNFAYGDGHVEPMTQDQYWKMNVLQRKRFLASPF